MDNFIVSARKYRPTTFDSVVGQQNITATLKNAIKTNHLAQAFLFCGPRGVGKTTCARILAKTINCFNITETIEACNECESCQSFNEGHSLNVYELDAASNNSVDDIRNLIEQVRLAPQLGTHKVYIIDEVHMLSQAAFNAFLKTLEEPPKHAIFILATTEKHKIIPTILSRCQVFDFNRIQIDDIANHLKNIAKKEGITAEDDALHIIAQKADGALRDALSIFDQIVSFSGKNITYKDVIENLNILDYDYYFKVTDAILKADVQQSLLLFNEILSHGFDGHLFLTGLAEHFRNLLVSKDASTLELLEVGNNIKEKYKLQSQKANLSFLINGLNVLQEADVQYKSSKNQRLLVEITLLKLNALMNASLTGSEKKNDINVIFNEPLPPLYTPVRTPPATATPPSKETKENKKAASSEKLNAYIPKNKKDDVQVKEVKIGSLLNNKRATSTGIFNRQTKEEKDTVTTPVDTLTTQTQSVAFSEDDLKRVWQDLRNYYNDKAIVKSLLSFDYKLNGSIIIVEYNNKSFNTTIATHAQEIIDFIRKSLQNYTVQLEFKYTPEKRVKTIYTPSEKFEYLLNKYDNLKALTNKLGLRPE